MIDNTLKRRCDDMEKMYNLKQSAELLGVTVRTLREWIKNGRLEAKRHKSGRNLIIAEKEIERIRNEME